MLNLKNLYSGHFGVFHSFVTYYFSEFRPLSKWGKPTGKADPVERRVEDDHLLGVLTIKSRV